VSIVFTFLFVDFFDTAGTLIGLSEKAGFMGKDGRIPRAMRVFTTDAVTTTLGSMLGTSANTAYVESAAGIEDGGKTGLVAVVVGLLFLVSLCFWPLASMVPACATAPVLMILGAMMMEPASRIDWGNAREGVPSFLVLAGMPLTFSISNGITLGIVSYVAISVFSGEWRKVHPVMYVIAMLLVARLVWLGGE
jgi:AGZA family xanthine/uracil permease-like MFS transporter